MTQQDYERVGRVIRDVTLKVLENYQGYDLLTCHDVIQTLKKELVTEFLKDDSLSQVEKFLQSCDIE